MLTQNRYLRSLFLVTLPIWVFLHACSVIFPSPTPTPTIPPTDTPTFTATSTFTPSLTSTNTPTITRTITPDKKATQAVEHETIARNVLDEFKFPSDTGSLGWYQTEGINIDISGPDGILKKVEDIKKAGDFVFFTNMTWYTDSWPTCGVIFRADSRWAKGDSYSAGFLRFSGLPAWDIEYYKDGQYAGIPSEKVRFSSYLNLETGGSNDIILAAIGNEFKVYVNNNFEGRYYDYSSRLTEGRLAFFATQDSGKTTCKFLDSWIWIYK
jgi:hypothetical protein